MFRNYFLTAWRNFFRNKSFSGINILGLSLGMACSLIIALWVLDEQNMDAFYEHDEHNSANVYGPNSILLRSKAK
jgi:uncharacterized membrane protein